MGKRKYEISLGANRPAASQSMVTITGVESAGMLDNYEMNGKKLSNDEFNQVMK